MICPLVGLVLPGWCTTCPELRGEAPYCGLIAERRRSARPDDGSSLKKNIKRDKPARRGGADAPTSGRPKRKEV